MKFSQTLSLLASGAALAEAVPFDFEYANYATEVGEYTYHYIQNEPQGDYKGTIVLIHGFPDLSYGWHNQVPFFASLGYRVIAPDMLGYAGTSAPTELEPYAYESMGTDIVSLIQCIVGADEQVIIGGHDWGAGFVWDLVVRYPELFKAVIGMAVPHYPPAPEYTDLADLIEQGERTNQGYMLEWREPEFADKIAGPDAIRQFLRAVSHSATSRSTVYEEN